MDEMAVDEFMDIVIDLRQQMKDLKRRVARLEAESIDAFGWDDYDEETGRDEIYNSK